MALPLKSNDREYTALPNIVAAFVGLDIKHWEFVRTVLSAEGPNDAH